MFVIPATKEGEKGCASEYLGVSYIVSYIKDRFSYYVLNADLHGLNTEQIIRLVNVKRPKIIGISVIQPAIRQTKDIIEAVKCDFPEIFICVGGHYPTLAYERILKNICGIDCIIVGEGEVVFKELAENVIYKKEWRFIKGIAYNQDGEVIANNNGQHVIDLDNLPFPDRGELQEVILNGGQYNVVSSRGCYGRCSFCSTPEFNREINVPSWRGRSPENVVAEIEELKKLYNANYISFIDDNFFGKGKQGADRVHRIGELILEKKLGIKYDFFCRIDNIDKDLFSFLKETGLGMVWIGVESNLEKDLKSYGKNIKAEKAIDSLELLDSLGINYKFGFIMFDPHTTIEDIEQKFEFIKIFTLKQKISPYRYLLSRLRVYDRTPIRQRLLNEGRLIENNFTKGYDSYNLDRSISILYNKIGNFYIKYIKPILDIMEKGRILFSNIDIGEDGLIKLEQMKHRMENIFLDLYGMAIFYVNKIDEDGMLGFEDSVALYIPVLCKIREDALKIIHAITETPDRYYNFELIICGMDGNKVTLMDTVTSNIFSIDSELYKIIKYCKYNIRSRIEKLAGMDGREFFKEIDHLIESGIITNHYKL